MNEWEFVVMVDEVGIRFSTDAFRFHRAVSYEHPILNPALDAGGFFVTCAKEWGGVGVTVRVLDSVPALDLEAAVGDGWESGTEQSLPFLRGPLFFCGDTTALDPPPRLLDVRGCLNVRVLCRGRQERGGGEAVSEWFEVSLWLSEGAIVSATVGHDLCFARSASAPAGLHQPGPVVAEVTAAADLGSARFACDGDFTFLGQSESVVARTVD